MSELSKMIPIQIRNDSTELFESPESSVITDSNSVAIQIHESYDIRNDDINEDYVVSYENEYFLNNNNNNNNSSENTISCIIDTQQLQQSFLQKVNNELLSFDGVRTPNQGVLAKTDSMLFHQFTFCEAKTPNVVSSGITKSPEICHNDVRTPERGVSEALATQNAGVRGITGDGLPSKVIGLSPTNTRSKLINAFLMSNSPWSSHTNSDSDGELSGNEPSSADNSPTQVVSPCSGNSSNAYLCESGVLHNNTSNSRYLIQEHVENAISNRKMHYKKISYEEIERSLSKYYDKNNKYSNEVDTLITFIRGQKHLYNQSCYITQIKLYALTITALSITSLITVVTPFIQQYWWRIIFVMSGNAITTVLITILKYMRFESSCNTFTLLSNHYEHYEHSLQITSNKLVFIQDEKEQTKLVLDKMQEIEFKMRETAELCPIIIPVEVQNTFPVIYQTNIFSLIKRMDTHRKTLIMQLKNIKNEIRYILYKWNGLSNPHFLEDTHETRSANEHIQIQREKIRLLFLMDQKENIKKELIEYKDNYTQIDDLFMKEIKYAETNKKCWKWLSCNRQKIQYTSYTNPVIKEHLELILS